MDFVVQQIDLAKKVRCNKLGCNFSYISNVGSKTCPILKKDDR